MYSTVRRVLSMQCTLTRRMWHCWKLRQRTTVCSEVTWTLVHYLKFPFVPLYFFMRITMCQWQWDEIIVYCKAYDLSGFTKYSNGVQSHRMLIFESVKILGLHFGTDICPTSHTHVITICSVSVISQLTYVSCVCTYICHSRRIFLPTFSYYFYLNQITCSN